MSQGRRAKRTGAKDNESKPKETAFCQKTSDGVKFMLPKKTKTPNNKDLPCENTKPAVSEIVSKQDAPVT